MRTTGNDIARLRGRLLLTQPQLASLVGVSPSTVTRWEKPPRDRPLRIELLQVRILTALQEEVRQKDEAELDAFIATLSKALLVRGGLFALYKLLEAVFDDD